MQVRAEQLDAHLAKTLAPVYLISGDDPLLMQESCDAIRAAARHRGFAERELFHASERNFDWQRLLAAANALSLFASRKILEVRLPGGKPGDQGSRALQQYCAAPTADNLLLVITAKLDRTTLNSKWVRALDQAGVQVAVWPVGEAQLPRWLDARLQRAGLRASAEALAILAERVEGNLLAATQEIAKLALLAPPGEIDGATLAALVADSARYNLFDLAQRALAGDQRGAARTLRGLRDEGTDPTLILWALAREVRALWAALDGAPDARKPQPRRALRRLQPTQLDLLVRQLAAADRAVKGLGDTPPWDALMDLVLCLSGAPPLNPANLRLGLRDALG